MTPKEKAADIFVKIMEYTPDSVVQNNDKAKHLAKLHALICVDEIINTLNEIGIISTSYKKYWQEVKQEIEKL